MLVLGLVRFVTALASTTDSICLQPATLTQPPTSIISVFWAWQGEESSEFQSFVNQNVIIYGWRSPHSGAVFAIVLGAVCLPACLSIYRLANVEDGVNCVDRLGQYIGYVCIERNCSKLWGSKITYSEYQRYASRTISSRVRIALAKNAGCLQNESQMLLSLLTSFAKQAWNKIS